MTVIYDSPVPRPPPFLNTSTGSTTILSGTRSILLIETQNLDKEKACEQSIEITTRGTNS